MQELGAASAADDDAALILSGAELGASGGLATMAAASSTGSDVEGRGASSWRFYDGEDKRRLFASLDARDEREGALRRALVAHVESADTADADTEKEERRAASAAKKAAVAAGGGDDAVACDDADVEEEDEEEDVDFPWRTEGHEWLEKRIARSHHAITGHGSKTKMTYGTIVGWINAEANIEEGETVGVALWRARHDDGDEEDLEEEEAREAVAEGEKDGAAAWPRWRKYKNSDLTSSGSGVGGLGGMGCIGSEADDLGLSGLAKRLLDIEAELCQPMKNQFSELKKTKKEEANQRHKTAKAHVKDSDARARAISVGEDGFDEAQEVLHRAKEAETVAEEAKKNIDCGPFAIWAGEKGAAAAAASSASEGGDGPPKVPRTDWVMGLKNHAGQPLAFLISKALELEDAIHDLQRPADKEEPTTKRASAADAQFEALFMTSALMVQQSLAKARAKFAAQRHAEGKPSEAGETAGGGEEAKWGAAAAAAAMNVDGDDGGAVAASAAATAASGSADNDDEEEEAAAAAAAAGVSTDEMAEANALWNENDWPAVWLTDLDEMNWVVCMLSEEPGKIKVFRRRSSSVVVRRHRSSWLISPLEEHQEHDTTHATRAASARGTTDTRKRPVAFKREIRIGRVVED